MRTPRLFRRGSDSGATPSRNGRNENATPWGKVVTYAIFAGVVLWAAYYAWGEDWLARRKSKAKTVAPRVHVPANLTDAVADWTRGLHDYAAALTLALRRPSVSQWIEELTPPEPPPAEDVGHDAATTPSITNIVLSGESSTNAATAEFELYFDQRVKGLTLENIRVVRTYGDAAAGATNVSAMPMRCRIVLDNITVGARGDLGIEVGTNAFQSANGKKANTNLFRSGFYNFDRFAPDGSVRRVVRRLAELPDFRIVSSDADGSMFARDVRGKPYTRGDAVTAPSGKKYLVAGIRRAGVWLAVNTSRPLPGIEDLPAFPGICKSERGRGIQLSNIPNPNLGRRFAGDTFKLNNHTYRVRSVGRSIVRFKMTPSGGETDIELVFLQL